MEKIKFQNRGFTSILTTFSFAVMSISGILLFIVPQGRIADWTNWRMLGLTKADWGGIHITTSLLFLAAGFLHTWYNWNVLAKYFARKKETGLALKRETLLALLIIIFFIAGPIYKVPPMNTILDLNNYVKNQWISDKEDEPPIGHAELLTVKSFAKKMNIDLTLATEELRKNGITFAERESLAGIAKRYHTSPRQVYSLIRQLERDAETASAVAAVKPSLGNIAYAGPIPQQTPKARALQSQQPKAYKTYTEEQVEERFEGRGIGQKKLNTFCAENSLDLELAKKKLAAAQFIIQDEETLKEASARFSIAPIEIVKTIMVGEPITDK